MCEAIGALYDFTPIQSHENLGHFRIRTWISPEAIFTWPEQDAVAIRRTKAQSETGSGLVYVHRFLQGGVHGRIGDLNIDRSPGAIYVFDQEQRVECFQTRMVSQGVYLRKSAIGFDPDRHPPLMKFPITTPLGKLLNAQFNHLFDQLSHDDAVNAAHLGRLNASLRLALGSDLSNGDVRRDARDAVYDLICAFIETRLDDLNLGVRMLLANFGVSRASLYRMFEKSGGVRQYISNRRLFRAVLDLSGHPIHRGRITEMASKWGFSSSPNFNRAFRNKFGVTPGRLAQSTAMNTHKPHIPREISYYTTSTLSGVEQLNGPSDPPAPSHRTIVKH